MQQQNQFHYLFNPYTLYCLLEFDLSKNNIERLVAEEFVVNDFLVKSNKMIQMQMKKKALIQKVINVLPTLSEAVYEQSVYKLGAAGLSPVNIQLLVDHDITYPQLASMTYDVFFERIGRKNKKASFERIKEAYKVCEILFQLDISARMYNFYLYQHCEQLAPRDYMKIDALCDVLSVRLSLPKAEIDVLYIEQFLEKKRAENYLTYAPHLGFAKKYKTVKAFLESDFKGKDILLRRMNGETLQDIGESLGVSRERIRQKEAKVLSRLPELEELIYYKDVFEAYNWNEEMFSLIYDESPEVYQLLDVKLKRGDTSVLEAVGELALTEVQQKLILAHFDCYINYEQQVMSYNNKMTFFEHLIFHLGQTAVSNEEFIEVANKYIEEHQLNPSLIFSERSALGMSDRSQKTLHTKNNGFRFYDTTKIEPEVFHQLKELLDLDPGVYSMSKLFRENEALMDELNIDSEYELHNLYKKCIEISGVTFTRMPEFSVQTTKDEFLKNLFYELAPIPVDEFLVYVETHYGLRQDSLYSLLYSDYLAFIHNNEIKVDYVEVSEEEYALMGALLQHDIYTVSEFIELGSKNIENFKEKFINNQALMKLDYNLKGLFILRRTYMSVDQYFTNLILKDELFKNTRTRHFKTNHFFTALYDLEKNLDVVKIAPDVYLTNKKLQDAGVTKDELIAYRNAAFEFAQVPYFTYHYLKNEGFEHEVENYGFDEIFYERIIWTHPQLRSLNTRKCTIFSKQQAQEFTLKDFISWLLIQHDEPLDFNFLQNRMQNEFGIDVKKEKLIYVMQNSTLHYSKELNKVYRSKEVFYETIYSKEG
ncbi:sigma factor-like helix-turn-helix DNA-binding protein [Metabacillus fastidiosus]|uniref:sigma factor-like helix-turn-helix DNA-binding protein n=1 Tax=Metabacillus fastidiosus TaxID=1458 RepID=UPI002E1EC6CF|nr:sigma factor-like helix-turn-helix DNA-binding protein [Metabacillus fastidiosus]MED4531497.1 sigma factor-like helix-turn-helix DNA-binding protein [Metabacillus fastidiosus]